MNFLGTTIQSIAWHKAGIFKPSAMAFTVPQPHEAMEVLAQVIILIETLSMKSVVGPVVPFLAREMKCFDDQILSFSALENVTLAYRLSLQFSHPIVPTATR